MNNIVALMPRQRRYDTSRMSGDIRHLRQGSRRGQTSDIGNKIKTKTHQKPPALDAFLSKILKRLPPYLHIPRYLLPFHIKDIKVRTIRQILTIKRPVPIILIAFHTIHFITPTIEDQQFIIWNPFDTFDVEVVVDAVTIWREARHNGKQFTVDADKNGGGIATIFVANRVGKLVRFV